MEKSSAAAAITGILYSLECVTRGGHIVSDSGRENSGRLNRSAMQENAMSEIRYAYCDGLLGKMLLVGDERGLRSINFPASKRAEQLQTEWREDLAGFAEAIRQLRAYFAGELTEFDLPLAFEGTEFQRRVWQSLRGIPYGETISYGQLATRLGNPKASRAVGLANGSNPIPIIVPCHRVIGSNGSLVGYGGGLENKKVLLALESRQRSLISAR
jgi:methylated-DNA-[protein]-cysteine S-methyltransferase